MATKKAGGSTSLGRDSVAKRLGTKLYDGEFAKAGNIIVRQRGMEIRPGKNVSAGKDYTLFSLADGYVDFYERKMKRFTGHLVPARFVQVVSEKPTIKASTDATTYKARLQKKAERMAIPSKKKYRVRPGHADRPLPVARQTRKRTTAR